MLDWEDDMVDCEDDDHEDDVDDWEDDMLDCEDDDHEDDIDDQSNTEEEMHDQIISKQDEDEERIEDEPSAQTEPRVTGESSSRPSAKTETRLIRIIGHSIRTPHRICSAYLRLHLKVKLSAILLPLLNSLFLILTTIPLHLLLRGTYSPGGWQEIQWKDGSVDPAGVGAPRRKKKNTREPSKRPTGIDESRDTRLKGKKSMA
ncbi:hypothetical protein DKX38_019463 [Salix brachista]|uniref:Uncharacterized protein n=1 Tax=Salix brachista TaxID=2182728 RepID=A0A5N5KG97_9ROSI|nr:hypothetical protein DKX38_019463 [Salix brachista]